MKPIIMTVADNAHIDSGSGKLYVLGTFTKMLFNSDKPMIHHKMFFVVKLASDLLSDDIGNHQLRLALLNSDGQEIVRVEAPFQIERGEGGLPSENNFIWELKNIHFRNEGEYQFSVDVDNEFLGSTGLIVAKRIPQE